MRLSAFIIRHVTESDAPNSLCLVAEEGQALIGFLNAMGSPVQRLRHATTLALGVRRDHWGRGVVRGLLGEALARVDLTVHTTHSRALALYRRMGFEIEGTRRRSLRLADRDVDEHLMSVIHET